MRLFSFRKRPPQTVVVGKSQPLDNPKIAVEVVASPSDLAKMLKHIEAQWGVLGASEPYWNVATEDRFKMERIDQNWEGFYETGKGCIRDFKRTAERCDIDIGGLRTCLELGCGAGRLTAWFSELFPQMYAVDISPEELSLARKAMTAFKRSGVDFLRLSDFGSIDAIQDFDAFVSFIVLQHNPPPIAAALLEKCLSKVKEGGIAYFQCQTYVPGYSFSVREYIDRIERDRMGEKFEAHCLPQATIFEILKRTGFELLEVREDGWTGENSISNSFFAKKTIKV